MPRWVGRHPANMRRGQLFRPLTQSDMERGSLPLWLSRLALVADPGRHRWGLSDDWTLRAVWCRVLVADDDPGHPADVQGPTVTDYLGVLSDDPDPPDGWVEIRHYSLTEPC
jgi:hypothetical protein